MTPRILIIAGSDSGGGAGIQADIKTVTMLGGHAMTAITAITAQNTLGVSGVHPIPTDMVIAQIDAVVRDIGVDAVKIGMIGSARTALAVAEKLAELPGVPVVFDPVMVATSGATLADDATIAAFERLMARASVTTPNLPELEALGGDARALVAAHGCAVLAKGGHGAGVQVTDRLYSANPDDPPEIEWSDPRIESEATHGTGCTLSSAIACGLAQEWDLPEAVNRARRFVRIAMRAAPALGRGHGPMGQQGVRLDLNLSFFEPMLNQVTVPAEDLAASERFYRLLGLRQVVRASPRYARFESEGGATFSIATDKSYTAPVVYFECGDLDVTVAYLQQQGFRFEQEPKDEPWGWREARLRDPAGNAVRLYQAGEMRRFPPWRLDDA
ncbi:hydroxymethylpyrimidine/phosphomethylpyrimidine kinase [Sphingomonas naasensis]|uniref:hydroxymethylpyrimidine kinase n=1 Tax=Sphingomonas naasensis TaxID=1344951 RepID=A0A4S1WEE4_9SPHN|nr:bifunctional hydroxymethylpyrimidine kinase/phosphomethylpyrimidine kinase [Sphingomonas naasensis]NIJ21672.1 hydroxymethylpyrimidine/phosphomethylpyrimidine kinase [Sphingomonas naasensis]TGX41398.1 bifunctional hydroxymethylpyrimidine kinase/phosphomethylpyrimidine kinase [Sphingomonas naasensis]